MSQSPTAPDDGQPPAMTQTIGDLDSPLRVHRLSFRPPSPTPQADSPERPAQDGGADAPGPSPRTNEPRPGPRSTKTGSSQGSSLVDTKVITEGISGTVIAITGQVHELLARDAYDQWAQVYLADEQDADGIAEPAAKIISRRTGDITGGNPDIADGIAMGIAVAFYLVKQMGKVLSARRARREGTDLVERTPPAASETPDEPHMGVEL